MKRSIKNTALVAVVASACALSTFNVPAYAALYSKDEFNVSLDNHDNAIMEKANGWTNGNPFNCTWRANNIAFNNGKMSLTIDKDYQGGTVPYSGAEYRSRDFFGYGMYETSMKAIKNDGVVSSFFTYTGPSDNNPWDEIDIEILGKDTTKVQFNYYTNGVGNHEYMYDLGFDASQGFHTYGFLWSKDSITWYVDGKPVYTANSNIPKTPSKIMMNVWPGIGVDGWLKAFNGKTPLTAEYDYISYKTEEAFKNGSSTGGGNQGGGNQGNVMLGDLDKNNKVDLVDYTILQKYLADRSTSIDMKAADMNNDGNVSIADLTALRDIILK